jgi:chromosome segregation ATPase
MDEQTFQEKFNELMDKIRELPEGQRSRLEQLAQETRERRERIQNSVAELQGSLDYLRLSVKYLVFDLEATRRENAYLRRLLEQSNRQRNEERTEYEDDNFYPGDSD